MLVAALFSEERVSAKKTGMRGEKQRDRKLSISEALSWSTTSSATKQLRRKFQARRLPSSAASSSGGGEFLPTSLAQVVVIGGWSSTGDRDVMLFDEQGFRVGNGDATVLASGMF